MDEIWDEFAFVLISTPTTSLGVHVNVPHVHLVWQTNLNLEVAGSKTLDGQVNLRSRSSIDHVGLWVNVNLQTRP